MSWWKAKKRGLMSWPRYMNLNKISDKLHAVKVIHTAEWKNECIRFWAAMMRSIWPTLMLPSISSQHPAGIQALEIMISWAESLRWLFLLVMKRCKSMELRKTLLYVSEFLLGKSRAFSNLMTAVKDTRIWGISGSIQAGEQPETILIRLRMKMMQGNGELGRQHVLVDSVTTGENLIITLTRWQNPPEEQISPVVKSYEGYDV